MLAIRIDFLFVYLLFMAGEEGFEPSSTSALEAGVLPLNYSPMVSLGGVEPPPREPQSRVLPLHHRLHIVAEQTGLEPARRLRGYWRFSKPLPYQLGLLLHASPLYTS